MLSKRYSAVLRSRILTLSASSGDKIINCVLFELIPIITLSALKRVDTSLYDFQFG